MARFGKEKLTPDTKKAWGMQYHFFEVPITLEGKRSLWAHSRLVQWEKQRKGSAKYWVSWTTLPLRNSMMLTVQLRRS